MSEPIESEGGDRLALFILLGVLGLTLASGIGYTARTKRHARPPAVEVPEVVKVLNTAGVQEAALTTGVDRTVEALALVLLKAREEEKGPDFGLATLKRISEAAGAVASADEEIGKTLVGLKADLTALESIAASALAEAPPAEGLTRVREAIGKLQKGYDDRGPVLRTRLDEALGVSKRALGAIERVPGKGLDTTAGRTAYKQGEAAIDKIEQRLVGVQDRHPGWFKWERANVLVGLVFFGGAVLYFIGKGARGERLKIRRISGLNAVDEAVGRATEMGKPVLYVTGIQDIDDVQTLAGLNILGHVARKTAEYEADLEVPCMWPMTLTSAQEVVREAYLKARKPDAHRPEKVYYLTSDQFAYAAGTSAIMLRQRPATVFYMGSFYAESLLLAEVGNVIGAIQVAGTAQITQLPFFVAACDYTLLGEELFAASAYLSQDPMLLGSLKGQDMGKLAFLATALLGGLVELAIAFCGAPAGWSIIRYFSSAGG